MDKESWCKNNAVHIAIVVNDIQNVLENYCRLFRLEKPNVKRTGATKDAKVEYRGLPTLTRAKQSFLQFGNLRIEFLEPDENNSTWREYLDKHGNIVHHIAFDVDNMEEALGILQEEGMALIQKGSYNGGRYAYIESEEKLGVMLELLQNDVK